MSVWRYTAVDLRTGPNGARRYGELSGATAADVRASLRRIGLQVIDIKPAGARRSSSRGRSFAADHLLDSINRYLRQRRAAQRCELYDSLATMLESGMPLLEAVQTVCGDRSATSRRGFSSRRTMLVLIREQIRSGAALDEAMGEHPAWFSAIEVAMVRAGQHGGDLSRVLRSLAQQHERTSELGQKLLAALAYPAIIATVGLGVVIFLSLKTLPDLTRILTDSGLEIPALTSRVMFIGQFLANHWPAILALAALLLLGTVLGPGMLLRWGIKLPSLAAATPAVLRRMAVGGMSLQLTELIRTGVPLVESLRVLGPTASSAQLRAILHQAADRVERGDELSSALDHPRWFDGEYRRLLDIGQATGELDVLLERLGLRYQRQARRLIDRMAALLEPCVMLTLAVLVGVVVMAAVLPLIRLQEVL